MQVLSCIYPVYERRKLDGGAELLAMVTPVAVNMVVEDLNMLLSDLNINCLDAGQNGFTEMGIRPGGYQDIAFTKSCDIVIEQTWALERALTSLGKRHGQETMSDPRGAGIIDVAISRGMPYPAQGDDLTAARYATRCTSCWDENSRLSLHSQSYYSEQKPLTTMRIQDARTKIHHRLQYSICERGVRDESTSSDSSKRSLFPIAHVAGLKR